MIRLTLPGAILACLAAVAVVAASAPAGTPTTNANRASGLQHDLEALVAAGAPGAILFVRDGERTTVLTAGRGDIAHKTPMRADNHFKIASLTKTYTATVVPPARSARASSGSTTPIERSRALGSSRTAAGSASVSSSITRAACTTSKTTRGISSPT